MGAEHCRQVLPGRGLLTAESSFGRVNQTKICCPGPTQETWQTNTKTGFARRSAKGRIQGQHSWLNRQKNVVLDHYGNKTLGTGSAWNQGSAMRWLLPADLPWCQEACVQLARISAEIPEFPHCSTCPSQHPCSPGLPSEPAGSPLRCPPVNTAASAPLGLSLSEITDNIALISGNLREHKSTIQ